MLFSLAAKERAETLEKEAKEEQDKVFDGMPGYLPIKIFFESLICALVKSNHS